MKKTIQLFLCLLAFGSLKAQITDSVPPIDLRDYMENLLSNIDQTSITSDILMEKGVVNIDFRDFDGTLSLENTSSYARFRSVYEQLYYAHLDTTQTGMLTPDSLSGLYRWHNAEKTTAIGLALYDYHYFQAQADANDTPYFTMSNDQLYDNPNASGSPYAQSTVFMAGPHEARTKSRFILPSQMFFSNITNTAQATVEVDFDNDSGWQTVVFDQEYPISYSDIGEKTIRVKLTANNTAYYCAFKVEVTEAASGAENHFYDAMWDDPNSSAEAHILYGTGNNNKIMRPVIFVEGFDFLDLLDEDDLFRIMNGQFGPFDPDGLVRQLQTNGYDVIILNLLRRGGASIRDNAEVLRRLIKWVNNQKSANGSTYKNVVGGASMGGIISRYALAKMEQEYCEDHEAKLYISYDAPHQGVYVPLSVQFLLKMSYGYSFGFVPLINERMDEIRCPANKQMFTAHIDNNGNPLGGHTGFYAELNNLGYPTQTRNIAVSLGNSSSNQPLDPNDGVSYNAGAPIMQISGKGDCTWCIEVNASCFSVTTNNAIVADVKVVNYLWKWFGARTSTVLMRKHYAFQSPLERENVSGGYLLTQSEVADAVNDFLDDSEATIPGNRMWHNLVSTPSAIDFVSPQWVSSLNGETEAQLLSNYGTPFDNVLFDRANFTSFHAGALQPNTTTFLFDEITQNGISTNPKFLKATISNATYNFGNPDFSEVPSVVIGINGIVKLNHSANTGYGDGPYANQSHFDAYSGSGLCGSIVVDNGGQLIVGESASKTADLFITDQTEVIIKNGGTLKINDGSKLIVRDGANITFEEGAQIILNGQNAILEVGGKISIGDNATFTFSGNGHIVLDQHIGRYVSGVWTNLYDNYWAFGENARIRLEGGWYTDLVLVVKNGTHPRMEDGTKPVEVRFSNGLIRIAKDQQFHIGSDLHMDFVRVESLNPNENHGGIRHWVQNAYIDECEFTGGGNIGALAFNNIGGNNTVTVGSSRFTGNTLGLYVSGEGVDIDHCTFQGNTGGAYLENLSRASQIAYSSFRDNSVGLKVSGQAGFSLNLQYNLIENQSQYGIELNYVESAVLRNNRILSNHIGVRSFSSVLDLSNEAYNCIEDNELGIEMLTHEDGFGGIFLNEGYNRFNLGTHPNGKYIAGAFCPDMPLSHYVGSQIDANNNQMPLRQVISPPGGPCCAYEMPVAILHKNHCFNGTYSPVTLYIPDNLTSIEGACGETGPGDDRIYEELALEFLGPGKMIYGDPFPGGLPLDEAILEAAAYVTRSGGDVRDDALALDYLQAVLLQEGESWTADELRMFELAYSLSKKAFANLHQYDPNYTDLSDPPEDDRLAFLTAYINEELGKLNLPVDSNTYAEFSWNLDYAQLHRAGNYYSSAIEHLNTAYSWASGVELDRANYWKCVCESEWGYVEGTMDEGAFQDALQNCAAAYPNASYKNGGSPYADVPGYAVPDEDGTNPIARIYPNPGSDQVIFELKSPVQEGMRVRIADLSGRLLSTVGIHLRSDRSFHIKMPALEPGTYLLTLVEGENIIETAKWSRE